MTTSKTDMLFTLGEASQRIGDWPDYVQYGFDQNDSAALIAVSNFFRAANRCMSPGKYKLSPHNSTVIE